MQSPLQILRNCPPFPTVIAISMTFTVIRLSQTFTSAIFRTAVQQLSTAAGAQLFTIARFLLY